MAEQEHEQAQGPEEHDEEEDNPNYKPPAPKGMQEILQQDAEDESLRKYKQALLGNVGDSAYIHDEKNPSKVIMQKLALVVKDRPEVFLDLTQDVKKESFVIKEECEYQIRFCFIVQREIVTGLKYEHTVYRKGIKVLKRTYMMGSYGPKPENYTFTTQTPETAPGGLVGRGDYKVKSRVTDDDGNEYASWEWHLQVKKDWASDA